MLVIMLMRRWAEIHRGRLTTRWWRVGPGLRSWEIGSLPNFRRVGRGFCWMGRLRTKKRCNFNGKCESNCYALVNGLFLRGISVDLRIKNPFKNSNESFEKLPPTRHNNSYKFFYGIQKNPCLLKTIQAARLPDATNFHNIRSTVHLRFEIWKPVTRLFRVIRDCTIGCVGFGS